MQRLVAGLVIGVIVGWFGHSLINRHSDQYEVVERTQDDAVANYREPGVHTAVSYVLLNGGHKIWASCDHTTVDHLDTNSSCALRPLKSYLCRPNMQGDKAMADLVCQDDTGKNVYLYASKKE